MPRASVVVPTYNRAYCLPATLNGLARQTHPDFEVVVVAGPSTDETEMVLDRFPRARVVRCPAARVGLARNLGAAAASGEIVAFTDDDAVPRPEWLALLCAAFEDPDVDAAGGFVWDPAAEAMQWRLCTSTRTGVVETDATGPVSRYLGRGADPFLYLPGCNMSVRRSRLADHGGFDEALSSIYEDTDLCLGIVDAGRRIAVLAEALVDHGFAANATRGEDGAVSDPSRLVHSYAVFIAHNPPPGADRAAVEHLTREHAAHWRATGRWLHDIGKLDPSRRDMFLRRVDEAEAAGLADGAAIRRRHTFPEPDHSAFLKFRAGHGPPPEAAKRVSASSAAGNLVQPARRTLRLTSFQR